MLQHHAQKRHAVFGLLLTSLCLLVAAGEDTRILEGTASCARRPKIVTDRRNTKAKLTIGTFNADFLFDGEHDPVFSPYHNDPQAARHHLEKVADVVAQWDPDMLVLQEVENCGVIDNLANLSGSHYEGYLLAGTDHWTQQNVGLLTKADPHEDLQRSHGAVQYPLPHSHCGYHSQRSLHTDVSKHFFTDFQFSGLPFTITLIAAHLKAFPNEPRSCSQREGQAAILRQLINHSIEQGKQVIVAGDLNDYSPNLLDIEDNTPKSRVLAMMMDPDEDGHMELHDVLVKLTHDDRYTDFYEHKPGGHHPACEFPSRWQHLSAIDHILMTETLWMAVERVWVNHLHNPCKVSDHWPLFVTLNMSQLLGTATSR